jgi:hypothetical protein
MVNMRKFWCLALVVLVSLYMISMLHPAFAEAKVHLTIVEWYGRGHGRLVLAEIPAEDNSMENPDYKLLPYYWHVTIKYWINPKNSYGFSTAEVVSTIRAAANAWDEQTSFILFAYQGTTRKSAGVRDGYNVVAWGLYSNPNVIAVTYIWYSGDAIVETDTRMNTRFKWSLSGEASKMDVQNIMTHEFGHWCGLADLYDDVDYWLTMYGYSSYGEIYKRTLGLGDILGLQARYGQ